MRNLYLLRGLPASGKSTWIKENNLERLTLSSDKLRLLFPQFGETITQVYDTQVWKLLYDLMEKRMQVGQDIIIDATHYRKAFIKDYWTYCQKYNYNLYIVQFATKLEICLERNALRTSDKVPEEVIYKMYNAIKSNQKEIESEYCVIRPDQALEHITMNKEDIEQYDVKGFYNEFITNYFNFQSNSDLDNLINTLRPIVLKYFPILHILDMKHNNKYHYRTILDHSIEILCRYRKEADKYHIDLSDNLVYPIICLFHDIGKPFAITYNKTDNYTHYYGHPLVGYQFFCEYLRYKFKLPDTILDNIAYAIKNHDKDIKDTENNPYMLLLHLADALSHIHYNTEANITYKIEDYQKINDRIDKAKELLSKIKIKVFTGFVDKYNNYIYDRDTIILEDERYIVDYDPDNDDWIVYSEAENDIRLENILNLEDIASKSKVVKGLWKDYEN